MAGRTGIIHGNRGCREHVQPVSETGVIVAGSVSEPKLFSTNSDPDLIGKQEFWIGILPKTSNGGKKVNLKIVENITC